MNSNSLLETTESLFVQSDLRINFPDRMALKIPRSRVWLFSLLLGSVLMIFLQLKGHAQLNIPASYKMEGLPGKGGPAVPARVWHYGADGNNITSNVPLNEINIRAFRQFGKMFPRISEENWFKNKDGYIVSFVQDLVRNQVQFNPKGAFQYTIRYYEEKDMSAELSRAIKRRFPDYRINVITEIMNGEKTLYLVKIENHLSVKTVSVVDGKMEITEDLVNGGQG
jgi:hypothetical protein